MEFSGHTWEVAFATSADRALALLQEKPADLVVIDIGMPMLDGLQLLGIISRRYPGLKLAVMTGSATEAKRADALANGAELFLEKPVTAEGMRSVFNMLNDLVSWTRREGLLTEVARSVEEETVRLQKAADVAPAAASPKQVAADDLHALGEDIIVVAEYDGTWTKTAEDEPPAGEKKA
jgi:CheY-like chemotaxis protein